MGEPRGGSRSRRRVLWESLLPRKGRFSILLSPVPSSLVGGAAAAIGLRFPAHHSVGGLKVGKLERYRHMLVAETAYGDGVPAR